MSKKTNQKAIVKLEALYARLPTVACKGLCAEVCGPVPMARIEANQCRKADAQRRLPMIREDATCVYLTQKERCGVYDARPLICRVWGTLKSLSCMHGCTPERWLTPHEFLAIGQAIERLGGPIVIGHVDGLMERDFSFLDMQANVGSQETVAVLEEKVRSLRALHGGRIVGVYPSDEERMINLDKTAEPSNV